MSNSSGAATPADSAADEHPNAGRNLPVAILVGVLLAGVALLTLYTARWLFVALVCAAICIGVYELTGAFANVGIKIARTPLYLGVVAATFAVYQWGIVAQLVTFGVITVFVLMWRIRRGTDGYVKDVTATIFVAAYLPFMAGFLMLTLEYPNGPQRVIVFICLTIASDIGGYAAGVTLGKHPIAPQISPKKSWEGFTGSVITQLIVGSWLFVWLLDSSWWAGAITGIVMTITATAGDFAESAIKRDLGVKDMSHLLPGHGGLMDRLDSLVPNAFASWAMFRLFLG